MEFAVKLLALAACLGGCSCFMDDIDFNERYSLKKLQWDNRPIWWILGRWINENPGNGKQLALNEYPYADIVDFGAGPTTVFGARPVNYTGHVYDATGKLQYYESGYLPVKNISSIFGGKDLAWPNSRLAFLTVSDRGYVTIEEGLGVDLNVMKVALKSLIKRGFDNIQFDVTQLSREFFIVGDRLFQHLVTTVNGKTSDFVVVYKKQLGWPCLQGCAFMEQFRSMPGACNLCRFSTRGS